jgi:structural maintenance of chromosome 1
VEERLSDVYKTLNQAKFDRKETDRADRLRNSVDALKRMFSGVHGRVIDLCTPVQKKFETAISVVLGKNLDAVIVDNDKIAIECIKVIFVVSIGEINLFLVFKRSAYRPSSIHSYR